MSDGQLFKVSQKLGVTTFENYSECILSIYLRPIKPKRKYVKIVIVQPKSFSMIDHRDHSVDVKRLAFCLEEV